MPRLFKSAFVFKPGFGSRLPDFAHTREAAAIAAKTFNIWKVRLQPAPQFP